MNITYKVFAYEFNRTLWAQTICDWIARIGARDLAELIGVDVATIGNWSKMDIRPGYQWPSMMNFMAVINYLDLDPDDFFVLSEA